jgi:predicted nucleic acid-binding protein
MPLLKLLKEHQIIALDTAIFIYHFEKDNCYFPATQILFHNIQSLHNKGVTTVVTLAEILIRPMQLENVEAIEDYKIVLNNFPGLTIIDIDQKICILAAQLRTKYSIKLPDAFQIGGALIKEATLFITNDNKLKKVKELKVIVLKDLLEIF